MSEDGHKEMLSASEEQDLEALLKSTDLTITDIDELSSKLTSQLTRLELENVDGLIESESAVQDVIKRLEEASLELGAVDTWLNYYNSQLTNMRQYIEHIEAKNNSMEIVTRNQKALMNELDALINHLDISDAAKQVLMQGDLATRGGLDQAIKAAAILGNALKADIKPELSEMLAVKEQRKVMEQLRVVFAKRLGTFMETVFTKLSEEVLKAAKASDTTDVPEHSELVYSKLSPYKPLVHWLADVDNEKYQALLNTYSKSMIKAYKKEMKHFFLGLNEAIIKEKTDQKAYFTEKGKIPEPAQKAPTPSPAPKKRGNVKRRKIDVAFRYGLNVVEAAVMGEQNFLKEFFRLPYKNSSKTTVDNTTNVIDSILEDLFGSITPKFKDMINEGDKWDNFFPLAMLVDADQYAAAHEDGSDYSAFLVKILNELQMLIKQLFNKFIDDQVESIKATQISLKRCGVLPYFAKFPLFVDHMEAMRAGKEGRDALNSVIDTAYHKVVMVLFSWLESQGEKDPEKFRCIAKLENFHHFSKEVMKRKVPSLEAYVKTAYDSFMNNMRIFANYLINRRFKPIVQYFQSMDDLLKTLPADDIQYQSSHSKQALNKLTDKISASALERGFIKALKNILKNLSVQENLSDEVIDELQNIFTTQYTHYEQLVARCYKNQKLPVNSRDLDGIFRTAKEKASKSG